MKNIRYVHTQNPFFDKRYRGYTIAYYRECHFLYFGYTKCLKNDPYVKETGRVYSTRALEDFLEQIEESEIDGTTFTPVNTGTMHMDEVKKSGPFSSVYYSNVFADHLIDDLNMMDFKHSFLSAVLTEYFFDNQNINYKL